MSDRIVLVGAGNMATAIACSLKENGNTPVAVWSRTLESAALLGDRVGCAFTNDLASLPAGHYRSGKRQAAHGTDLESGAVCAGVQRRAL